MYFSLLKLSIMYYARLSRFYAFLLLYSTYVGIVKMQGKESEIIISNNVNSNKLFLRIQKGRKRVTVAKNPGVS